MRVGDQDLPAELLERVADNEPPTRRIRVWQTDFERHEALLNRVEMKGLHRRPVAAGR